MTLLVDNYDSFTYNLFDYIKQVGEEVVIVKNDELTIKEIASLQFDNILLSPGPRTPLEAGIMMDLIKEFHKRCPILGICLGHQAIGQFFGANLRKSNRPMHGKTSLIQHEHHPVFNGLNNPFTAMRYHSLILDDLPTQLKSIAKTETEEIMAIVHETLPILGIQFHPESILTDGGPIIIKNWFDYIHALSNKID